MLRAFCFTINNPTAPIDFDESWMGYLIYQEEVGASGTRHYQGYCETVSQSRFATIKARMPDGAHIEKRQGTQEKAIAYCKKTDTRKDGPWEFGTPKEQGKRNDLLDLALLAKAGKRKRDAFEEMPATYARYFKNYEHIQSLYQPERPSVQVTLLVGPPGTGKTRRVREDEPDCWMLPAATPMWFNGYDGHAAACLDDFAGQLPLDLALRLLDRYPVQVPTKGGFVWWTPARVYITSNFDVEDWYDYTSRPAHLAALKRRIHRTIRFHADTPFDIPPRSSPEGAGRPEADFCVSEKKDPYLERFESRQKGK